MTNPCEGCGALPSVIASGPWAGQRHLHNYCKHCSMELCEECIVNRKCRENPAKKHEVED